MQQSKSLQSTLKSAGNLVKIDVEGLSSLVINLTGTFVGTTVFEYTINGSDWYALTANIIDSATTATGATATGKWVANVAGFLSVRVRCTAYTSGTINVALRASLINGGNTSDKPTNKKITTSGSITYIAIAVPGTAQSAAAWQAKKVDATDPNNILETWAGSGAFNQVATDLTALTYA